MINFINGDIDNKNINHVFFKGIIIFYKIWILIINKAINYILFK